MYVIAGIFSALIVGLVFNWGAASILFLASIAYQSIPARFAIGRQNNQTQRMTRVQAEKWLRDNGYEEQTPEELRQAIAEERDTHNWNAASSAFWAGSETYIDCDGNCRDVATHQIEGR